MKKMNAVLLSTLVLCASLWPVLAADSPPVLAVMEIRGLDNLANSASELSKAVGQPTPKEALSFMLYDALGTMPGMGIQAEGTVRTLWLGDDLKKGSMAILLPLEVDGPSYLEGLIEAGWLNQSEVPLGIQHYIAPKGSEMLWRDIYFLKSGSTLVAAETAEDVRKANQAVADLPSILPVEGDLAIQVYPAALMDLFEPEIQKQMDKALKSNPAAPQEAAAMSELYMRGYVAVAKQMDAFTFGLGVNGGHLNIHSRVTPIEGTTLAKWLASIRVPSAAASVVNLPGALLVETANLGDISLIGPAYFQYMEELMSLMPQPSEDDFMDTYLENAQTYWEQMTGDFGFSLLPPTKENPLRIAEYVALKDNAILRGLVQEMSQDANALMKTMASDTNMPVPFTLNLITGEPREYREIPVDALTYDLKLGEGLSSVWPEGLTTKLDVEMAWVPGGVLVSVGDSSLTDQLVDRALDGTASPVSDLPAWQALYPSPDHNLVDVSHVALFDMVRSYLGLADSIMDGNLADNIPAGSGNLESASYMAMGGVMSRVRIGVNDIAAIAQKIQEAREAAVAEMMKQMEMQGQMQIEFEDESMDEEMDWSPDDDAEDSHDWNPGADATDWSPDDNADNGMDRNPGVDAIDWSPDDDAGESFDRPEKVNPSAADVPALDLDAPPPSAAME